AHCRRSVKLFAFLESLGFDYAIRFRGNIQVAAENGETRLAADWVGKGGRARMLREVEITIARCKVSAVVCVHAKDMKEPWCIATSHRDATGREIVNHLRQEMDDRTGLSDIVWDAGLARRTLARQHHGRPRRRLGRRPHAACRKLSLSKPRHPCRSCVLHRRL